MFASGQVGAATAGAATHLGMQPRETTAATEGEDTINPTSFQQDVDTESTADLSKKLKKLAQKNGLDGSTIQRYWNAFKKFDVDQSGELKSEEVHAVLQHVGDECSQEEFERLFSEMDPNGNGSVSFEEFIKIYRGSPFEKASAMDEEIDQHVARVKAHCRRSVFLPAEEKVKIGVDLSDIRDFLIAEVREEGACMELPWLLAMFICWMVAITLRTRLYAAFVQEHSVEFDLLENANYAWSGAIPFETGRMGHKTLFDVNTIADFWSWLNMGLVPLLWVSEWDVNEVRQNVLAACQAAMDPDAWRGWGLDTPRGFYDSPPANVPFSDVVTPHGNCIERNLEPLAQQEVGRYLYFNRLVGGLRMRQERAPEVSPCRTWEPLRAVFDGTCYDTAYDMEPDTRQGIHFDHSRLHDEDVHLLLSQLNQTEVRRRFRKLEDEHWFQHHTQKVELGFVIFNADYNIVVLTFIEIFVTRSGHFWKHVNPLSIWLDPYEEPWSSVFEVCFVLLLVRSLVCEVRFLLYVSTEGSGMMGKRKKLRDVMPFISFWVVLEWIHLMAAVVVMLSWVYVVKSGWEVAESLQSFTAGKTNSEKHALDFIALTERVCLLHHEFRLVIAFYPFITMLRLFRSFSAQPRLALVTQTLSRASIDVIHFMVVFGTVFMTFALAGMCLFGLDIENFATLPRASHTTFLVLLGEFDWESMRRVGKLEAALWFWTFNVLVLWVMLNMLLSIVMDTYMVVKANVGSEAETLWSQVAETYARAREIRMKRALPIKMVLKSLGAHQYDNGPWTDGEEKLTTQDMMIRVPGISEEKALQILLSAQRASDEKDISKLTLSEAFEHITAIQAEVNQCHDYIQNVTKLSTLTAERASTVRVLDERKRKDDLELHKQMISQSYKGAPPAGDSLTELTGLVRRVISQQERLAHQLAGQEETVAKIQMDVVCLRDAASGSFRSSQEKISSRAQEKVSSRTQAKVPTWNPQNTERTAARTTSMPVCCDPAQSGGASTSC